MKELLKLIDRISSKININLRKMDFNVRPYIYKNSQLDRLVKFYAFYGITSHHPLHFNFIHSSLAGSYFLGKCKVDKSVVYKSDVRGDELKRQGDICQYDGLAIPVDDDEKIRIKDSYLIKTLVHNYSHDPEDPEEFLIRNTLATHYANIHGSPMEGCFLGPFSTVDLSTLHACIIGEFAYLQVSELFNHKIEPGTVWIKSEAFDYKYQFPKDILGKYIRFNKDNIPEGIFMDFVEERKNDFQDIYDVVTFDANIPVPYSSALNQYSVVKGNTNISENVLVAQRAYLENAWMGMGSNAQENTYIINSRLESNNVTAHGGKIINAKLGSKVFVGFNSFLYGREESPLAIGAKTIVMPHTIIDLDEPLEIPENSIVWGYIKNKEDLELNSIDINEFVKVDGEFQRGFLTFKGKGKIFVNAFKDRIEHILEANGAYYNGTNNRGHAQEGQNISFNTIQPYFSGKLKGIYPTMEILP